ncbi:hypothetical protein [Aeromicrobium endophyticum]|uniref:Uncharacterized protein n=1 Tax=Aeromicrobium endophyticum TaxID=2292704 RepID=A0A371P227_9ACTN|nr:hypothetical protein [Aeromicrobium endophyticum]REK70003.1 hypothetical protein DX116_12525 [Aeromicrobium endophyticum]
MSTEVWILAATAVLAVVAICAAVIAVRAVRRVGTIATQPVEDPATPATRDAPAPSADVIVHEAVVTSLPTELEPRVVEGRLVVPPTQHQVVQAALGRPGVRLSIALHGVTYALRAESRDRITALMRREFRRRRRERLQAGRRAVRSTRPTPPSDQWLGS